MREIYENEIEIVDGGYSSNVLIFVDGGVEHPVALNLAGRIEIAMHLTFDRM